MRQFHLLKQEQETATYMLTKVQILIDGSSEVIYKNTVDLAVPLKKNSKHMISVRKRKKAFLAGLIRGSGEIFTTEDGLGFDFALPDEDAVNTVSMFFKILYGFEVREVSVSLDHLNKKDKFIVFSN